VETGEIVTVYWVILMRTIGMGELEEIGRSCWQIGNGVYPYEYFGLKARIALAVFLIGAILPSSVIIR
jgi:hypothetical protein